MTNIINTVLTQNFLMRLNEYVFIVDSNGVILETTQSNSELKNIQEIIHKRDWHDLQFVFKKDFSNDLSFIEIELELKISDKYIWHLCKIAYLKQNNEGDRVFVLSFNNIEKQKQREFSLIMAKEHAQAQEKIKTNFLSSMSHEIRTPMNSIIGFAGLLKEASNHQEEEQYIDIIESSGEHLLSIINDIIDVSKIESGTLNIKIQRININELIDELVDIYRSDNRLKGKDVKIISHKPLSDEEANIISDGMRLRQVLSNLMDNSVKFTLQGEIELGYRIIENKKNEDETLLNLYVKDTGIGIPKEEHSLIFDRFHQVSEGDEIKGSGLGLAIVESLVKKLGGQIGLKSKKGEGSVFKFSIPFLKVKKELYGGGAQDKGVLKPDLKNRHILITEDVPANYKLIAAVLKGTFAKLTWAKNGQQAVEAILSHDDFDLILMDLHMPVMDGYKATEHIKTINPKIPIIALTAYAIEGDMEKALNAGCDDYITKPISIPELYRKIKFFLDI